MLSLPDVTNGLPKAQLYTLTETAGGANFGTNFLTAENQGQIVINFPNLPDELALSRSSSWNPTSSQFLPDGIPIYNHTDPFELPFSFKIHAFDDYSINGPETLIQISAKLHALVLPIITTDQNAKAGTKPVSDTVVAGKTNANKDNPSTPPDNGATGINFSSSTGAEGYYFPPVCAFNLMVGSEGIASNGLGIFMVGYVRSVDVRLKGPWLSSDDQSHNQNLPTSGEFNFIFVHCPGYTNDLSGFKSGSTLNTSQVGANQMRTRFYNTGSLAKGGVKGLDATFASSAPLVRR